MIPKIPYKPWSIDEKKFPKEGSIQEQLKFLISYAILAPNSHNTQPWLFRIVDHSVEIIPNLKRALDYSDRTFRELYTSLGCALANLLVASEYFGFNHKVEYLPEDTLKDIAATVHFSKAIKRNSKLKNIFPYIQERVVNRSSYLSRPIKKEILDESISFVDEKEIKIRFITNKQIIKKIADILYEAHMFAFGDKYFKEELSQWVRSIYTNQSDGMPLFGFGIPAPFTIFAKKMVRYNLAKIQSTKDKQLVLGSPMLLLITSKYDTKEYWLKSGKIFEYLFLTLTKNKIAVAPLAGIIEHPLSKEKLTKLIDSKEIPLFFARVGYPSSEVHHSPRISSNEVIIT